MLSRRRFLLASVAASVAAPAAAEAINDGVALFASEHPVGCLPVGEVVNVPYLHYSLGYVVDRDAALSNLYSDCSDLTEESLRRFMAEIGRDRTGRLAASMRETKWNVQADILNRSFS